MTRCARLGVVVVVCAAAEGCGHDTAAQDDSSSSSTSSDASTHEVGGSPSSDEGTPSTSSPMTSADEGSTSSGEEGDGGTETGVAPGCPACSGMSPQPLNSTASIQLNPGRTIGEGGDGRGVAGSHMFEDETAEAAVFDPVAATWGAPQVLRNVGPWEEQQYTRMEVARTDDGAVLLEDGNGRLFAHHLVGDAWTSVELTSIPDKRYIFDVEPAPDGRVAVLVMSQTSWDQPSALHVAFFDPST